MVAFRDAVVNILVNATEFFRIIFPRLCKIVCTILRILHKGSIILHQTKIDEFNFSSRNIIDNIGQFDIFMNNVMIVEKFNTLE
jgi:hypothetical protein